VSTGTATADILAAFDLEPAGDGRFRAGHARSTHGVVFGGQLLGQALLAAGAGHEGKTVKTLHAVFARGATPDVPLDIQVEPVHGGRSFASATVTLRQGDRTCVRAQVLLSADEPDCIRHAEPAPTVAAPPDDRDAPAEWLVQIVGDVDISDPAAVGPAELDVWTRFPGAPDDPALNQALLAFATDGFVIGTAMRPHDGVGQAQAHKTLSTGVISHTITFHEAVDAGAWNLLSHRAPYAGRGRAYGTADVFDGAGQLVASFVQDAMIRPRDPAAGGKL
jgi:acyl-CoA thioesterase II